MNTNIIFWVGFNIFVLIMLALDLGVFHRKAHKVSIKEASIWSVVWITLALIFNVFIYFQFGEQKATEFLTGYLIEKSLSVDNIFVFVIIFGFFQIPDEYQHKVLFWGILGALIMRIIFIFAGVALINQFHWTIYIFGAFLVFTGFKMIAKKDKKVKLENSKTIKFLKKKFSITDELHGDKFFIKQGNKKFATPLFLVLILIEITDLIFAVDSIPAILAITQDQFIVYTSNVFAILGLRSLYFALAHIVHRFVYLSIGLAIVLMFIGMKMLLIDVFKIPTYISLIFIVLVITISIVLSLRKVKPVQGN